jgi:hypothetical protein
MRLVVPQQHQAGSRLPILEPVSPLPGLPAIPGEIRRPVAAAAVRTRREESR